MLYAEWDWDEYIAVQRREAAEDAAAQARDEERKAAIKIVAQARDEAKYEKALDAAKKALEMGLSSEQAAKLADLSVDEVATLVKNH